MYSFYNPRAIRVVADFKYTQEEDIFNQLAYGIRCLDLRVSASGSTHSPKYKIAHDVLSGDASVLEVLRQVKDFVEVRPAIIIISCMNDKHFRWWQGGSRLLVPMLATYSVCFYIFDNSNNAKAFREVWRRMLAEANSKFRLTGRAAFLGTYWGTPFPYETKTNYNAIDAYLQLKLLDISR